MITITVPIKPLLNSEKVLCDKYFIDVGLTVELPYKKCYFPRNVEKKNKRR